MNTIYIETSVVSNLRQRPSSQVVMAAHQLQTHRWWDNERTNYELVVSQYVIDEVSAGDPTLAADRLQTLDGIAVLPPAPEIPRIANEIMSRAILPPNAQVDALIVERGRSRISRNGSISTRKRSESSLRRRRGFHCGSTLTERPCSSHEFKIISSRRSLSRSSRTSG